MNNGRALNCILKTDDLNQLMNLINSGQITENAIFSFRSFTIPEILQKSPSILQVSVFYGSINCFKYLLESGSNIDYQDSNKRTLSHFACAGGSMDVIPILCEYGVQFNFNDHLGNSCAHYAIMYHHLDVLYWLWSNLGIDLAAKDAMGNTPMHLAAMNEDQEALLFLCQNGCDINCRNDVFFLSKEFH